MTPAPVRVAMWSCPRNISTAMMRSWGNRPDTTVCDEPLYAYYLNATGRAHPGADEVIAAGPTQLADVIAWVLGPAPAGKPVFYQKHMTHHLLPETDRDWIRQLTNCFLIRSPEDMITSFIKHVPDAVLLDTGYPQQAELFDLVCQWTGRIPPVLDSRDVLDHPRQMLRKLCAQLELDFDEQMLSWPPGLRATDGVWAKYWYKEVERTTSFQPFRPKHEPVPPHLQEMVQICRQHYQRLYEHRLTPD